MHIHTTSASDTIYKIARQYSVQPTKILEDNGLLSDRLAVGEELLILTPTRTATVRGTETLTSVAQRFGIKKNTLIANNPSLCGKEKVRPGQILSVKFDTPPLGVASAVGFLNKSCTAGKLRRTLPYLTYVISEAMEISDGGVRRHFDDSVLRQSLNRSGKISLIGFSDTTAGAFLTGDLEKLICDMIALAKTDGFRGIYICAGEAMLKYPNEFSSFMLNLRKQLIGCDLILFAAGYKGSNYEICDIADGAILFAKIGEEEEICAYSEIAESSKAFISTETLAKSECGFMEICDALKIAERRGIKIEKTEDKLCTYSFNKYTRGKREPCSVSFPSLEKVKSRLELGSEAGFLGVAFDIATVPTSYLSLFNVCFARADYSLAGLEE